MPRSVKSVKPAWINPREYSFRSRFHQLPMGRMHYVDEGQGKPVVMVHGNPAWSFLYRHQIKGLSRQHRCVAMDHIGFGLSDKPANWSYRPEEHAKNLTSFIEALGLKNITLMVQDWGGPIGLNYAINNPDNVAGIILTNTWMWSGKWDLRHEFFARFYGGPFGVFLAKKVNFFPQVLMRFVMANGLSLPRNVHQHYTMPLANPEERMGCYIFPREVIGSSKWLGSLWSQLDKIRDKPTLILWGMKDPVFRRQELEKWESALSNYTTRRFEDVGHFVAEEKRSELNPIIQEFLSKI